MGWKGNVRSFNAAVKRAEKYQRQVEKQRHLEDCHSFVARYNFQVDELVSYHKSCSPFVNWEEMRLKKEPITPIRKYEKAIKVKLQLKYDKPNFLINFLKLKKLVKKILMIKLINARKDDKKLFDDEFKIFNVVHAKWDKEKKLSDRVYVNDIGAYEEFVLSENTFNKIGSIGTRVDISFDRKKFEVKIKVNNEDIIPRNSYFLLKSGKLSEKEIPRTQFYRSYQDHVCSVVLRIARELTTIFPLDEVVVTAIGDILNSTTGNIEEQVILSAQIPKATLARFNMRNINPSDAMKNFRHNMNFKSGVGFSPVEKIKIVNNLNAA